MSASNFQSVLTKKFILKEKAAVIQYMAAVNRKIERLKVKLTSQ
jgi:hypothetical protein